MTVYHLKHATGQMKIQHMKSVLAFRADLQEKQDAHARFFNDRWNEAMDALEALDPEWEAWYDARPEQTAGKMLPVILERIALLTAKETK